MECMCGEITSKEPSRLGTSCHGVPHLIRTCDRYACA